MSKDPLDIDLMQYDAFASVLAEALARCEKEGWVNLDELYTEMDRTYRTRITTNPTLESLLDSSRSIMYRLTEDVNRHQEDLS